MRIKVTFGGALTRFLPEGTKGNRQSINIVTGVTVSDLLAQYGVPSDERLLVILNGNVVQPDQFVNAALADGDALSLMPPIQAG